MYANFIGQVAAGFAADLLVLNENPLGNIAILDMPEQHVLVTMKDGRIVASRWSKLVTGIGKTTSIGE